MAESGPRLDHAGSTSSAFAPPRAPAAAGPEFSLQNLSVIAPGQPRLQAKLTVGARDDRYEQEADRVAEAVLRSQGPAPDVSDAITPLIRRAPEEPDLEEEELLLQAKQVPGTTQEPLAAAGLHVDAIRSQGRPLPGSVRAFFEPRFGYDFGRVRLHTGERAADATRLLNARAFTVGRDVMFGKGEYAPHTTTGRRLLAHELTHTIQQRRAGASPTALAGLRRPVSAGASLPHGVLQRQARPQEDTRIRRINHIVQSELDNFLPGYKVLLQALLTASKIGGVPQLVADLRARPHKEHGTYFIAFLRIMKSRGGPAIYKLSLKLLSRAGVGVHEAVEDYPLRFQIADYLSRKIGETKKILIGQPKDSIWWVLKATLIETFYTIEEGFVDALRVGKGSEEAARAYAFEKNAVDRWAGVVKGLAEDFLRLTVVFAPAQKAVARTAERQLAKQLAGKADDTIRNFSGNMRSARQRAATQAEKKAAGVAETASEATRKKVKSSLSKEPKLEIEPTAHPKVGDVKTRKPRGFEPTAKGTKKRVKAGKLEGLEPTRHKAAPRPRRKSVTREQQLRGIEPKSASKSAREAFNKVRDEHAKKLGVGKGGQVHHAAELQVLDRYPGVFTARELNALKNMRGIPAEQGGLRQLHNAKIREVWNRLYRVLDRKIAQLGLKPGTAPYNKLVRQHIADGVKEIDHVLGQFFSEVRKKLF